MTARVVFMVAAVLCLSLQLASGAPVLQGRAIVRTSDLCRLEIVKVSIGARPLSQAVAELEHLAKCPVLIDRALLTNVPSCPVRGTYTPREALLRLLGAAASVDVAQTVLGLAVTPLTYQDPLRLEASGGVSSRCVSEAETSDKP